MVNLSLTEKGGTTSELSFDKGEVTVGRVRGNDIILPKGNISKYHCRLLVKGDELLVEDLHSTNGTYLNGRRITEPTPISTADKIFVGDFILRLNLLSSTAEIMRPSHLAGPPEAGSLGAAVPRRPPPPPPGSRPGSGADEPPLAGLSGRAHLGGHAGAALGTGSVAAPPAPSPPPPPRAKVGATMMDAAFPAQGGPSEIKLDDDDDELRTPHPRITVPPLKPAIQPAGSLIDVDAESPGPRRAPGRGEVSIPPEPSSATGRAAEPAPNAARPLAEPIKGKAAPAAPAAGSSLVDREWPEWLADLLGSEGVSAAFFAGGDQSEILRNGRRETALVSPADIAGLEAVVRQLAGRGAPKPAPDAAVIMTTLADGTRFSAIFPPLVDRLCVAIRRPVVSGKTIDELVAQGALSVEMRQVLEACLATRQNVMIVGDRAACDVVMRALLWSVDRVARVMLISDTITPPASATAWIKVQPDEQAAAAVAAAVAMEPDYLVLDADHMAQSDEVIGACNLGMKGVILSLGARSASDAIHRTGLGSASTVSAGGAGGIPGIDVVVHAAVLVDGTVKVIEVAEPKPGLDGRWASHALLVWIPDRERGSFRVTGAHAALAAKLAAAGNPLAPEILSQ
ncbi:MAG: ATPase, T2SS/T4P/T4SS family [Polyangia bacterium]|jgi:pilus assembly protein CpaF